MSGRPTKLTDALQSRIADAVATGVPYLKACEQEGISSSAAKEWVRRGEERDEHRPSVPRYVTFVALIKKAKAQDQSRRIARIEAAAKGGIVVYEKRTTYPDGKVVVEQRKTAPEWTADAWHLERSDPESWGRKERPKWSGNSGYSEDDKIASATRGVGVMVVPGMLTPDQWQEAAQAFHAKRAEENGDGSKADTNADT